MFGIEPHLLALPTPDVRQKFYGESSTDDLIRKLLFARNVARQNNEDASEAARQQFDSTAAAHKFLPQQLVLLDEHSFLGKNQKLVPKWSGPHKILRLKGDCNVELQLKHNNRKTVVHANRLKPYFVASKNLAVCPDFIEGQQPQPQPTAHIVTSPVEQTEDNAAQFYDNSPTMLNLPDLQHMQIAPPQNPSLVLNPPSISRRTRTCTRTASSSHTHTLSEEPPSARTRSRSQLSSFSPVKPPLIMPQVTFHPLPIPEGGEGLQEENEDNQLTINILNDEEGWTIVCRKKKKKNQAKTDKSDGWNKQQKINFEQYGDIWYEPPY